MNYDISAGRKAISDIKLPAQVKIIDTGRFVPVDLDEMHITGDIGNWLEPLGLLSIVVEAFVLWQSIAAVVGMPRKAR